eukprot:TRINITY_DN11992_c0_g1_i1.p1 TRINITY_DN11992_c0_g1~~TRINITY_DN11992_c0_g1_i1.p1  ORF type:complete len:401 (+),score=160.65 TRINITY_DN11992_c0_g1_i1:45-1247(+)
MNVQVEKAPGEYVLIELADTDTISVLKSKVRMATGMTAPDALFTLKVRNRDECVLNDDDALHTKYLTTNDILILVACSGSECKMDNESQEGDPKKDTVIDIPKEGEERRKTTFLVRFEKYSHILTILCCTFVVLSLLVLTTATIINNGTDSDDENIFWVNQLCKYGVISLVQFIGGIAAEKYHVKVSYTRKVVHVFYFVWPQLLDKVLLGFDRTIYSEAWNIMIIMLVLIALIEPIRERVRLCQIMFAAVDRPEDRPLTLFWSVSQLLASLLVVFGAAMLFRHYDKGDWVFIPLLVLTIGDGLAEPIGVTFSTPATTFQVKGLCVDRYYTRSLQGSGWVWGFACASVAIFYTQFTTKQFIFNILILPVAEMLIEAHSPHTWDNPMILLGGYLVLFMSYWI